MGFCCGQQQPPSLFSISNNIKQRGTLNKNPKNIFYPNFCILDSLKAISHRREKVKSFPMRINKLQRSNAKFIASHILKAPLKENEKESLTADMRRRISQTSQKQHTTSK